MDPTPRSALSPGDVIAGKFRLERVIGRGGMGSVWAARQVQIDMPVALKFIEAEGDSVTAGDVRARFEREARAAGQIRSPHVVQILDHGIDGDRPYIVMELLEGEDLGQRLRRDGRLGIAACARILTQAAKALRRAHEAGIVHRDLKPGNVFLARFDDDEVVKILDFGVAKMRRAGAIEEPLLTQIGVVFGSPAYMSPEQARGARVLDHRTDLWSLAVIVYRAVTGVKPFQAESIADLVVKLCIDPLPVATRAAPHLPPEIDRFFERAFARDPDQRFPTAPEMAAAFEAVAAASPIAVAAPSPPTPSPPEPTPRPGVPAELVPVSSVPPSGSGPHPGFATGTLTPPPAPMAAAPLGPPLVPLPAIGPAPPLPAARPPLSIPKLIAAGTTLGLIALLVLVVVVSTSPRPPAPAASATPALAAPPPVPAEASTSAKPPASAEPSASAQAPASADPPVAEGTAAPKPAAGPRPQQTGKKKKPNFGY